MMESGGGGIDTMSGSSILSSPAKGQHEPNKTIRPDKSSQIGKEIRRVFVNRWRWGGIARADWRMASKRSCFEFDHNRNPEGEGTK